MTAQGNRLRRVIRRTDGKPVALNGQGQRTLAQGVLSVMALVVIVRVSKFQSEIFQQIFQLSGRHPPGRNINQAVFSIK